MQYMAVRGQRKKSWLRSEEKSEIEKVNIMTVTSDKIKQD